MSDIELVIKISREQYSLIMQSHRDGVARFVDKEAMMHAIKKGIPLPENHDDLIDRKELKKKAYIVQDWMGGLASIVEEFSIDDAPAIISAARKGDDDNL